MKEYAGWIWWHKTDRETGSRSGFSVVLSFTGLKLFFSAKFQRYTEKNTEKLLLCIQLFCRQTSTCSPSASLGGTSAPTTAFTSVTLIQVNEGTILLQLASLWSVYSRFVCIICPTGRNLHSEPDYDRVLMRIMHLFEKGEDPELSKPVTINIKVLTNIQQL